MCEGEEGEREEQDVSFDDDQQRMFANENRAANATRPQVGSQVDPILPGAPTSEEEKESEK